LLYGINEQLNATLVVSNKLVLLACNFIVKESCIQVIIMICIHHASCLTFHHVEHISLSHIVTGGEDVTVDQVPEEEHPSGRLGLISMVRQKILTPPLTKASPGAFKLFPCIL
jgi:hypothetical protein